MTDFFHCSFFEESIFILFIAIAHNSIYLLCASISFNIKSQLTFLYEFDQHMSRYVVNACNDAVNFTNIVINDDFQTNFNADYAVAGMSYTYEYGFNNKYGNLKAYYLIRLLIKNQMFSTLGQKITITTLTENFIKQLE